VETLSKRNVVAMILAGGEGKRLGVLTKNTAKPAIPFAGKYKLIDFPLSNCEHSGIYTVGVLTQYMPLELNSYVGNGSTWNLDRNDGGVFILPPYMTDLIGSWYSGTANAVFQNMNFIDKFSPENVVILSGDHVYKMDYSKMLAFHKARGADVTIAVINVPHDDISRFGIMKVDKEWRITDFQEKPKESDSTLASMGVYVFKWEVLRKCLLDDNMDFDSAHDFGKDIIPKMLKDKCKAYAYEFNGYWKDVGTIKSFWEANMELLDGKMNFKLDDNDWRIYSKNPVNPPHYIGKNANVQNSLITEGGRTLGTVRHSVLFESTIIEEDALVEDSIIFSNVIIKKGAQVKKSIIASNSIIGEYSQVGSSFANEGGG
jgi:glucose-1-phosphate adenylyltransferase